MIRAGLSSQEFTRAEIRALDHIYKNFINTSPTHSEKIERIITLRNIRPFGSHQTIQACLNYLAEHGLPGSGERCIDPLRYLLKNFNSVKSAAESWQAQAAPYIKQAEKSDTETSEEIRAQKSEFEALALFQREYPTKAERVAAIDREFDQFQVETGTAPDRTDEIYQRLMIARIASRLSLAIPVINEFQKKAG